MLRINLLLLLAVMMSALFLVGTQYESRKLFTELDRAENESRRLATDQQRLQVENAPRPRLSALKRWHVKSCRCVPHRLPSPSMCRKEALRELRNDA